MVISRGHAGSLFDYGLFCRGGPVLQTDVVRHAPHFRTTTRLIGDDPGQARPVFSRRPSALRRGDREVRLVFWPR